MSQTRTYNAKVYQSDGTFISEINKKIILSDISFRSSINSGQGALVLDVVSQFDSPPTWASFNNFIKIFCVKVEKKIQTEELLFTGFISQIEHNLQGSNESMKITALSLGSILGLALYKDGSNFDVVKSDDPAVIAQDIISKTNAIIGTSWLTASANVETVGTSVSYTFSKKKLLDSMNQTLKFAGGDYYWHIGADGDLYFKNMPTAATHKFNIAKHVNYITATNNSETINNEYSVDHGPSTYTATNATSVSNYWKRDKFKEDADMSETTAEQYADGIVLDKALPKLQVRAEINTKYDIESVKPGHSCKFYGLKIGSTTLNNNMLIVAVDYKPESAIITLENDFADFGINLRNFNAE